jgi:hypothetical protein
MEIEDQSFCAVQRSTRTSDTDSAGRDVDLEVSLDPGILSTERQF